MGQTTVAPHGGVEDIWIIGIHFEVGRASIFVEVEDLFPGGSTVDGFKDTALFVAIPEVAHGGDEEDVFVFGVDCDIGNAFGIFEADGLPFLAVVGRLIDAGAYADAVAGPGLTGTDVDDVSVRRSDGDGSDALAVVVKDRLDVASGGGGSPDAAAGGADEDRGRILGVYFDATDAATHDGGADLAGAEVAEQGGGGFEVGLG